MMDDTKTFIQKNPNLAIKDIVNATGADKSIVIQIIEEMEREIEKQREIEREKLESVKESIPV